MFGLGFECQVVHCTYAKNTGQSCEYGKSFTMQCNSGPEGRFKIFDFIQTIDGAGSFRAQSPLVFMAAVAQLVEHRVVVLVVAGSSPVGRPIFFK